MQVGMPSVAAPPVLRPTNNTAKSVSLLILPIPKGLLVWVWEMRERDAGGFNGCTAFRWVKPPSNPPKGAW
jgi:hypothetical protein